MDQLPLVISAISTTSIIILAAQTLWKFWSSSSNANQKKLYEDQDGVATEDSQKAYLRYVRVLKYSIAALWSAGCILALSAAILNTTAIRSLLFFDWITFASWVSKPISSTELAELINLTASDLSPNHSLSSFAPAYSTL